jgi:hypothetical protein
MATKRVHTLASSIIHASHVGGGGAIQIGVRTRTALSAGTGTGDIEPNLIHLNMVG